MRWNWPGDVLAHIAHGPLVRVVVIATAGSAPREVGAAMLVSATMTRGTIGGGALEFDVIARARRLLADDATPWLRETARYHLGPELQQCCGGVVEVLLERFGDSELGQLQILAAAGGTVQRPLHPGLPLQTAAPGVPVGLMRDIKPHELFVEAVAAPSTPVVIYGAGHVGRAVVAALAPLPFAITWAGVAWEQFPPGHRDLVAETAAIDPAAVTALGGSTALHLVMTHSHALDEAIVAAILRRGEFGYLGLIGSATKAARFRQRLSRSGVTPALLERLECPIGLPGITGNSPGVIAASVAADLLMRCQTAPHFPFDRAGRVD